MKIKKVEIENFRSIKKLEFNFPDEGLLVLVGSNNAGKSNIVRAINNVLGEPSISKSKLEEYDYYMRKRENEIKIKIFFNNGDKAEFTSNKEYPNYFDNNGNTIYSAEFKEKFPCIYLQATRDLEKHLQFYQWSLMGKISRDFHRKVPQDVREKLEGEFDEIMNLLKNEIPNFKNFIEDVAKFYEELEAESFYKLKVDFKPFDPTNYFRTIFLLAEDPILKKNLNLEELGEGSKNLILLALLRAYAKNFKREAQGLFIIEEPEIYLHPTARRHIYEIFLDITQNSNIQLILTTHSPTFVDTEKFYNLGMVYKIKDEENSGYYHTQLKMVSKDELVDFCKDTGVPENKVSAYNISPFYRTTSNSKLNEAFFAKFLILVEGETEELALPVYLNYKGINCNSRGIVVVGVGGKNQVPKYWRLFYKFGIPMLILFDNDNSKEKEESNKNLARCFNLGINDILNEVSIYKKLLGKKEKNGKCLYEQTLIVLEKDFETAIEVELRRKGENYINKYNQIKDEAIKVIKPYKEGAEIKSQKGAVAKYVAEKLTEEIDYVPSFVEETIKIIEQKLNSKE